MEINVMMAQMAVSHGEDTLRTTLGSCVGVVLFHKEKQIYGLAHVMLPASSPGRDKPEGKYADTAIPGLLKMMTLRPSQFSEVQAKIVGGSNMFAKVNENTLPIGEQNITAVKAILKEHKIPVVGEELGGSRGKQLVVDPSSALVMVNNIGENPKEV